MSSTPTESAKPAAPTTAPVIAPTTTPTAVSQAPPTAAPPPPTKAAAPAPPAAQLVRVTGAGAEGVNLRAEPSTAAPRIKRLTDGMQLVIVGADRQADGRAWHDVKDPSDGAADWVAADFLTTATDPLAAARPSWAPAAGEGLVGPNAAPKPAAPAPAPTTAVPAKRVAPRVAATSPPVNSGAMICNDGYTRP